MSDRVPEGLVECNDPECTHFDCAQVRAARAKEAWLSAPAAVTGGRSWVYHHAGGDALQRTHKHSGSIQRCPYVDCRVFVLYNTKAMSETRNLSDPAPSCPSCGSANRATRGRPGLLADEWCTDPWHGNEPAPIAGVGPDAPTQTEDSGAQQSAVQYAMTSIDPHALLALARVHHEGDTKYGRDNWRGIGVDSHLNHALIHLTAWLAGDRSDDHLAHALCRVEMALAQQLAFERKEEQ